MFETKNSRIYYPPIRSCPICHSDAEVIKGERVWVECISCGWMSESLHTNVEDAVNEWNKQRERSKA